WMTKIGRRPRLPGGEASPGSGVSPKRRLRAYSRRLTAQDQARLRAAAFFVPFFAFLAVFFEAAFFAVFFAGAAFLAGVRLLRSMLCCNSDMKSTTLVAAPSSAAASDSGVRLTTPSA